MLCKNDCSQTWVQRPPLGPQKIVTVVDRWSVLKVFFVDKWSLLTGGRCWTDVAFVIQVGTLKSWSLGTVGRFSDVVVSSSFM